MPFGGVARRGSCPKKAGFVPRPGDKNISGPWAEFGAMITTVHSRPAALRFRQFFALAKPRVVSLIVFTAMIGMFLATSGVIALQPFLFGVIGIALVAGSAAAVNCLLEQKIDALMTRTRARPLPRGQVTSAEALAFAVVVGTAGLALLYSLVNPLTMWLAVGTFIGYAFVYTVVLNRCSAGLR